MTPEQANPNFTLQVFDAQKKPLGGTVDITITSQATGAAINLKGADASRDIAIPLPKGLPAGAYRITVTAPNGSGETVISFGGGGPFSAAVTVAAAPSVSAIRIPPGLMAAVTTAASATTAAPTAQIATPVIDTPVRRRQAVLDGSLVFNNGLPAANVTIRLYHVGFAGKTTLLGEARADAQGNYSFTYDVPTGGANLQVRAVDSAQKEVTISATRFQAGASETLHLGAPVTVQPLASEYDRLSADVSRITGGMAALGQAREGASRQDLSLLAQSTRWDARLLALASTAAQQAAALKLPASAIEVLYALYRTGLPTDSQTLALVSTDAVKTALVKATRAGIVSLNGDEFSAALSTFSKFATQMQLAMTSPGAVSTFGDMFPANVSQAEQSAFTAAYFHNPSAGAELWSHAATAGVSAPTLDRLKLHGRFLYLTYNSAPLAQYLTSQVGSVDRLSALADHDYHTPDAWKTALNALAGSGGQAALDKLIPATYDGATTAERLDAYSGDMARKVRLSFPTPVTARMLENHQLQLANGTGVSTFLKSAANLGYELGRTPLHAFLAKSGSALPALDQPARESLKRLHRLYQITPSPESLQGALTAGLTSAYQVASYTHDDFIKRYASDFPSAAEASMVYRKSQQVASVTFNFFAMAKQLDTNPPIYGMSASAGASQSAKDAIVQQFPSISSLFGSLDFCQCDDCRSVLSPAAYFVDCLEFLRNSGANQAGCTPLDVLLGSPTVAGRRPDLAALPLSCENTNTALPYIDIVNEILEYYIAHSQLDGGVAYNTGSATTADLIAEPQHVLPQVYNATLRNARYPMNLPFDLWIEMVRGFLNYFKIPLAQVLDTMRPVDALELFTDAAALPYYRAQILAEALGLSPAEYNVLASIDPVTQLPTVQNWFQLYGYQDEPTALGALSNASTLANALGLTYQEITDLVSTGFLNPALNAIRYQFERFQIDMRTAFTYTGQPGYTPALSATGKLAFEAVLDGITARYKQQNPASTFDARAWLAAALPANYSTRVLILRDPSSGCDFGSTTLVYADGSSVKALDLLKLNLFVRLWKKLGWTLDETDRAMQAFFPSKLPAWTDAGFAAAFSSAWKTGLVSLAHLDDLNTRLAPSGGRTALLPLWTALPVVGSGPLYAQLFLNPGVLAGDWAFDDPAGSFPWSAGDALSTHQATVQGVLGLSAAEVAAILADAGSAVKTVNVVIGGQTVAVPSFSLANISICYRYSLLAQCLDLAVADLIALKTLSGLNPFQPLGGNSVAALADDVLWNQTLAFVKMAAAVSDSGFTIEDLQYLLRHQFDPVGKYQQDQNALLSLVQSVANGLGQIRNQNAVPAGLLNSPETLIDQRLSSLFPAAILKALFAQLTNAQTYTAAQGGVAPASALDPVPFANESALSFTYDPVTQVQTVSYRGLLLDDKKNELLPIANSALFAGLLAGVQQQAVGVFARNAGNVLGVWASLAQYEAVRSLAAALPADAPTAADPALTLSYDQATGIQWLGYRGVLTDTRKKALTALNASPELAALLEDVQHQAMPAYRELLGSMLAMLLNLQSFQASQAAVAEGNQVDPSVFDAYPQARFSYDQDSQTQTLVYQGVLTEADRAAMAALLPGSAVAQNLLQTVRSSAVALFLSLAGDLLSINAADVDAFSQPFLGIDAGQKQKRVKAELVTAFLPLVARKLSRDLAANSIGANLGSDPALTTALITDAGYVSDPSHPGISLLSTFLGIGNPGVSATYYASADGTGAPLATGMAATADTADPTNPNAGKPGTGSAHFEGYLQVPADGPYRLYAELGNTNSAASVTIDAPDPTILMNNPVLAPSVQAAKDYDEVSQFVQLRAGILYHFTADFTHLGANGASLQIQGEHLPKGPLNQIALLAQDAVQAFLRARLLLAKTLQILTGMGLDEREVGYLTANAEQFAGLDFSALPTQASDDSAPQAVLLLRQFLALADYAGLRRDVAGASDGLIGVFQNVNMVFTEPTGSSDSNHDTRTPWNRLATLSRRDPQTVRDLALHFGLVQETVAGSLRQVQAVGDFANNRGVRRLWDALQIVQIIGIPVSAMTAATGIVSAAPSAPDVIAVNLKNAVKAQYTVDAWRPIAQSIFDPLRRQKRDALVSYLVNQIPLENANQLFEYFFVDPGMEPVVQTSRLRLAMSSVQTFIQRCLLDLENGNTKHPERNISPRAIDADWWSWMKRYRVWEANREIFLFPENWMEPELRLDKTDLFESLESTLLQGDITNDLVEDAFLDYLKGLEVRARLDIVSVYLDQDPNHLDISTLYALGRTYGVPHKYFFRTYSSGAWNGWQAVTPDIAGDHMVLVVWRGKLNLFWVTFVNRTQAQPAPAPGKPTDGSAASLPLNTLADGILANKPKVQVQVQLHWAEYLSGKWSPPLSTDVSHYPPIDVFEGFDPVQDVFIHVSKELDAQGNEGAALIHLDLNLGGGNSYRSFRVTSKNCDPGFAMYPNPGHSTPYNAYGVDATAITGSATLDSSFFTELVVGGSSGSWTTEHILHQANVYAVVPCANPVSPPFISPSEPDYSDAGMLVSPFFLKDTANPSVTAGAPFYDELSFFVQPSLTEKTMVEWDGYAVAPSKPSRIWDDPNLWDKVAVQSQVPDPAGPVINPDPGYSLYGIQQSADWATDPATVVAFGDAWIGKSGGIAQAPAAGAPALVLVTQEGARLNLSQSLKQAPAAAAGQVG